MSNAVHIPHGEQLHPKWADAVHNDMITTYLDPWLGDNVWSIPVEVPSTATTTEAPNTGG